MYLVYEPCMELLKFSSDTDLIQYRKLLTYTADPDRSEHILTLEDAIQEWKINEDMNLDDVRHEIFAEYNIDL